MKLLSILKKTDSKKSSYFNLKSLKHFPSSIREWNNSIYLYNKNALPFIPHISSIAFDLINNYLFFYNKKLENYITTKKIKKIKKNKKATSHKIFISKGEFKHTNNKVTITLYVYNREKKNIYLRLKRRYINIFFNKKLALKKKKLTDSVFNILSNKLILIKKIKKINTESFKALLKANSHKFKLITILKYLNDNNKLTKHKNISTYLNKFYKTVVKLSLKKIVIYMFYKQLFYLNKSKFNYTYLQYLKNNLQGLFNKNIEFNFVNLKQFYLDSDIFSDIVLLKIKKNRRKLYKFLSMVKNKIKIKKKKKYSRKGLNRSYTTKHFYNKKLLQKYIMINLKYRHITGFRLEAKGRLTKRYAAAKSVYKYTYKGGLINNDSSYRGFSTVLLKGNLKSNLQFTKVNSKTRIGAFGIKGWISGN